MPNGDIELDWADGKHLFNVAKIAQLLELEEKCGAGVAEIFERLRKGTWRFNDVRETVRLGLIGGGLPASSALALVQRYVDGASQAHRRALLETRHVAFTVLTAAMVGVPGDNNLGKTPAERTATESPEGSSAPLSTAPVPQSDSPPAPLTQ